MADISLDYNKASPTYKDLLVIDGDLVLTSDENELGTNPILQDCVQRLSFFWREWFLDNTQGLPFYQQILIKNPDLAKIDALFINVILGTPGIESLLSYSFDLNTVTRTLTVKFKANTSSGVIDWTGDVPVNGGLNNG